MIPSRSGGGCAGVGVTASGADGFEEDVAGDAKAVMGDAFAQCEVALKRVVKV